MPPVFKRVSDGQVRYRPGGVDSPFYTEVTKTTTGNIDDLDFTNANTIRMNNATDSTIRGLVAGVGGQRVTIVSVGAGNVYLAHQNAGSAAANKLINPATSGNTPLAAGSGKAVYVYDDTTDRWRLEAHQQGAYIQIVHSAGDYTTNNGTTWAIYVPSFSMAYQLRDSQLHVIGFLDWDLSASTAVQLQFTLPNGYTVAGSTQALAFMKDNSVRVTCRLSVTVAGTQINISRLDGAAMTGSGGSFPTFFGQNGFNLLLGVS